MLPVLTPRAVLWLRVGDGQFRTPVSKGLWFNDYGDIRRKKKPGRWDRKILERMENGYLVLKWSPMERAPLLCVSGTVGAHSDPRCVPTSGPGP